MKCITFCQKTSGHPRMQGMQSYPLENIFAQNLGELIRFGQNQNLASPKTIELLQLCRIL